MLGLLVCCFAKLGLLVRRFTELGLLVRGFAELGLIVRRFAEIGLFDCCKRVVFACSLGECLFVESSVGTCFNLGVEGDKH